MLARTQWDFATLLDWQSGEGLTVDLRPDLARSEYRSSLPPGEDDPAGAARRCRGGGAAMPPALVEFHRIPGARHSIFRDSPAALQTVRSFVRRIDELEQAEPE